MYFTVDIVQNICLKISVWALFFVSTCTMSFKKKVSANKVEEKKNLGIFIILSMLKNEDFTATVINSFQAKRHCSKTLLR